MFKPTGLRMACLECPRNQYGEAKEWKLEKMEESMGQDTRPWVKFLAHLDTRTHRGFVNRRLAKLEEFM
jgi:hypothetical protein